jgi:hypothetical protein
MSKKASRKSVAISLISIDSMVTKAAATAVAEEGDHIRASTSVKSGSKGVITSSKRTGTIASKKSVPAPKIPAGGESKRKTCSFGGCPNVVRSKGKCKLHGGVRNREGGGRGKD